MSSTQAQKDTNLLYQHSGLKNIDLDKLSTKHVELLEIQNKLYFYRKRTKNIVLKTLYSIAFYSMKLIIFFEINKICVSRCDNERR